MLRRTMFFARPARLPLSACLLSVLSACGESWTWSPAGSGPGGGGTDTAVDASHDLDHDGYAGTAFGGDDCWDDPATIPSGFAAISGWTQPVAADVHPGAAEAWYDGVDQDCGGDDDFDQDGDGHRSQVHVDVSGTAGDDCYDAVDDGIPEGPSSCGRTGELTPAEVHPGATDIAYDGVDADCSGNDDFDQDEDGFGRCAECDDTNAAIYPNDGPDSWYDGVDSNCDGNDGDQDGDGYYVAGYAFTVPPDFEAGDCADDPTDPRSALNGFPSVAADAIHPGVAETWYDGVDGDCAGDDDFDQDVDGQDTTTWPNASGAVGVDCVDTDSTVFAGAADAWYDGIDSDCAGNDDYDQDGDGFEAGVDCDDLDSAANPGVVEDCATAADDDCSGTTNDTDATGCASFSPDLDGDGYGDLDGAACLCVADATHTLSGVTSADADCDDVDATVNPGETEVCNDGVDHDCDGGAGAGGLTGGSLSGAGVKYTGESASDLAGLLVSAARDVNGDGFDDLLIGSLHSGTGGADAGAAYVVLGSAAPSSESLSSAIRLDGAATGDYAGVAGAGVGDTDGDGYDDLLVGAPHRRTTVANAGEVYLVLGSPSPAAAPLSAGITYSGEIAGGTVGNFVSGAGDVNADGYDDMMVGAMSQGSVELYAGVAYLILGGPAATTSSLASAVRYDGMAEYEQAGRSVAAAGDIDGDGFDDVLVGAFGNGDAGTGAGAAYLILGSSSPTSTSLGAEIEYTGANAGDEAGISVSGAGDVDGDGYPDMLVGADGVGGSATGAAYLLLGSALPSSQSLASAVSFLGANPGDYTGTAVSGVGDVDGDGHPDLMIGAPGANSEAGASYLVYGSSSPAPENLVGCLTFSGENASDYSGVSVSGVGDVDADGQADLLIGSYTGATDAGAAYLILGQGI